MDRQGKAAVVVMILLLVVSLALGGYAFVSFQKEKQQRIALEERIDDLELMKKKAEERLDKANQDIAKLTKDIGALKVENNDLNQRLETETRSKEDALTQNVSLKNELDQQKANLADLQNKLSAKEKEITEIQKQLADLKVAKEELEKAQAAQQEASGVNLEKIVVAPTGKESQGPQTNISPARKQLQGKVLVINKEYRFTIINLGKRDGVNMGDTFTVSRSGKRLGEIQVEKIHDTMSAANFLDPKLIDMVKEDDVVVKK